MAENLAMSAEVDTAGFLSLGKSTEDRTKKRDVRKHIPFFLFRCNHFDTVQ